MTETEARARLERMTAHSVEPVLSVSEITDLLNGAKVTDIEGRAPTDAGWVPTWNLRPAAKTGWEWKAGRASGYYTFGADGQSFSRDQVYDHCMAMVRRYSTGSGSVVLESPYPLRSAW